METDNETKRFIQRIQQAILDLKSKKDLPIVLRVIQELRDDANYVYEHDSFKKNLERCVADGYFCQIPDRTTPACEDHWAALFDCEKYKIQRTFSVATRENVKEAVKAAVRELTGFRASDYPGVTGDEVCSFIGRTYTVSLTPEDLKMRVRKTLQELALNGDIVFRNRLYRLPESQEHSSIDGDSDTCDSILSATEKSVSSFSPESSRPTLAPTSRSCSVYSIQSDQNLPSETTSPIETVKQEDTSSSGPADHDVETNKADTVENVADSTKEPQCCKRCNTADTNIEHFNEYHNGLLLEEQNTFPLQQRKARWFAAVEKGHRLHCEAVSCTVQPRSSSELYRHLKSCHPGPETREAKTPKPEAVVVGIKQKVTNGVNNRGKALSLPKSKIPTDEIKYGATKRQKVVRNSPESPNQSAEDDQTDSEEEKDSATNTTYQRSTPDVCSSPHLRNHGETSQQTKKVQGKTSQEDEPPRKKKLPGRPRKNDAASAGAGTANQKNSTGRNSGKVKDEDPTDKVTDSEDSDKDQSTQIQRSTPNVVAVTKRDSRKRVLPSSDEEDTTVDKPVAEPSKVTGLGPAKKPAASSSNLIRRKNSIPHAPPSSSSTVQRKAPNPALIANAPESKEGDQQHAFAKALFKGKTSVGVKNVTFFRTQLDKIKAAKTAEESKGSPIQPKKIDFDSKPACIAES